MTEKTQSNEKSSSKLSSSIRSSRSSFFSTKRLSFFRSKGTRGADVETLRGNTGANFEGYARVARCGDYMNCCGVKFGTVEESTSVRKKLNNLVDFNKMINTFIHKKQTEKATFPADERMFPLHIYS